MDEYVENWLIKAEHDLKAAGNELKISDADLVPDIICFTKDLIEKTGF